METKEILDIWKYLDVIENCSREGESWHFIFTIQEQEKETLIKLVNFLEILNEDYKKQRQDFLNSDTWKNLVASSSIFFRPRPMIANSSFSFSVKNEIKIFGEWNYMAKENWIHEKINNETLDKIIEDYKLDKDKNNPFYKWGILWITK